MFADELLLPPQASASPATHHASRPRSPKRPASSKPQPPVVLPVAPEPVAESTLSTPTTSVTRTYAHLHYPSYVGYCALFSACRTTLYHPMTIAITRKQGLTDYGALPSRQILRNLVKKEGGARALTTGLGAMVLANSCSETIYSGLFECLRFELPIDNEVSRDAAAGYSSDAACRFIYTPLLLVANRQMTQTAPIMGNKGVDRVVSSHADNSLRSVASSVYRAEGARGFFRGLGATITVGCAWSGVWWPMYAQLKKALYASVGPHLPAADGSVGRHLPAWLIDRDDNCAINAAASVVTSASTAVLFNPFLVVRTRLQIDATSKSVGTVMRSVLRESGPRGFFKGTMLSVSACVVDGVLAASCYEWAKYLADNTHHQAK